MGSSDDSPFAGERPDASPWPTRPVQPGACFPGLPRPASRLLPTVWQAGHLSGSHISFDKDTKACNPLPDAATTSTVHLEGCRPCGTEGSTGATRHPSERARGGPRLRPVVPAARNTFLYHLYSDVTSGPLPRALPFQGPLILCEGPTLPLTTGALCPTASEQKSSLCDEAPNE